MPLPQRLPRFQKVLGNALLGVAGLGLLWVLTVYISSALYQRFEQERFALELLPAPPARTLPVHPEFQLHPGSPFGRLEIPRLQVSVMVIEGSSSRDLQLGVGHILGTALPGDFGNVGLAGHRDTFFRKLEQLQAQDAITFTTLSGVFHYRAISTSIVSPNAVEVLHPTSNPELTLVTCYPFYYVGHAPKRFIVRARRVSE
jgi:sortase A